MIHNFLNKQVKPIIAKLATTLLPAQQPTKKPLTLITIKIINGLYRKLLDKLNPILTIDINILLYIHVDVVEGLDVDELWDGDYYLVEDVCLGLVAVEQDFEEEVDLGLG